MRFVLPAVFVQFPDSFSTNKDEENEFLNDGRRRLLNSLAAVMDEHAFYTLTTSVHLGICKANTESESTRRAVRVSVFLTTDTVDSRLEQLAEAMKLTVSRLIRAMYIAVHFDPFPVVVSVTKLSEFNA
ncbi:MAG TPA: hypothetical protein VLF59_02560 [Candidatus Saccharimonadales bacterium]|nr:hypothetical protein [Candidatus Saccharimonadales bacterium]